jgi:hypothetical protein
VKDALTNDHVSLWSKNLDAERHAKTTAFLMEVDGQSIRKECSEARLIELEQLLLPLTTAALVDTREAPPEATHLVTDSEVVRAAAAAIASAGLSETVDKLGQLLTCLAAIEDAIRVQIRVRSDKIIDDISADIQRMWSILHPSVAIADVRLQHPDTAEKAIDIELTFHGVALKSPRLTLSEGYRNSLGLCVFLAMALRRGGDTPVILDDVVVSLDRDHRGMIADLLEKEFSGRQVIVFTHDREWYIELRHRLNEKEWTFHVLRPYASPTDGIGWSTKSSTFDDARGYLDSAPDVAGNTARKIMDRELAVRAEKLRVKMPYLQSFKNDHRMAHEFMECLIAASTAAFQVRDGKDYEPFTEAGDVPSKSQQISCSVG